jgi:two-component system sensor histidine kinase KdpD
VRVRETVPDWVVDEADEVRLIDLTPRALRHRLERGVVYSSDKARQAMEHFFTESNLAALRELALRYAAHEVEGKLESSVENGEAGSASRERILICVTGNPFSASLIRRGKRVADYLRADCMALHVLPEGGWTSLPAGVREAVERHIHFARNLRIEMHTVAGGEVARAIAAFARTHQITQIFLGRSAPRRWFRLSNASCGSPPTPRSPSWRNAAGEPALPAYRDSVFILTLTQSGQNGSTAVCSVTYRKRGLVKVLEVPPK